MNDKTKASIDDPHIIRSGRMDVGDGHEIYWVDWGNPDVEEPVFFLHGGPGGGFDVWHFDCFDPAQHRVIFHDQRGSGRSTPFASTEANTTEHLVNDITKLKDELGFQRISLFWLFVGLNAIATLCHSKSASRKQYAHRWYLLGSRGG